MKREKGFLFKIKLNKYKLAIILILFLSALLRFYRVSDRWSIYSDSARDILVGRQALKLKQFPLVGSFSSAGPFVFGPLFYWLISLGYLPNINFLILPWIIIGIISIVFVWVMIKCGEQIWGKRGAVILGLLAAISPAQISRSLNLTQHTLIGISGATTLFAFISYLKTQKSKYLFLMGLALGFALSIHYQAINLLFFAIAVFLTSNFNLKKISQNLVLLLLGILIPSLPLLYWDSQQNWANFRNLLDYLFIGQYRIYVPNRWLTYLFQFWPQFWASVAGGETILGWFFIFLSLIILVQKFLSKKLSKTTSWLGLIFLLQIFLLRYHRGERFEGYLIYFHPLILFFSALSLKNLGKKWQKIGLLALFITTLANIKVVLPELRHSQNQVPKLQKIVYQLKEHFPEKKFDLYDYKMSSSAYSFGLAAFLDSQNLIDEQNGIPIGVCIHSCPSQASLVSDIYQPSKVVDLSPFPKSELKKPSWYNVNPRDVFDEVALWWQKEKLQSSFSLQKFILGKVGLKK